MKAKIKATPITPPKAAPAVPTLSPDQQAKVLKDDNDILQHQVRMLRQSLTEADKLMELQAKTTEIVLNQNAGLIQELTVLKQKLEQATSPDLKDAWTTFVGSLISEAKVAKDSASKEYRNYYEANKGKFSESFRKFMENLKG